jgi:predicted MFS family arabinose efflux permease
MMSASPLAGALAVPMVSEIIAHSGWRTAYVALAGVSGIGGLLAIALIGSSSQGAPVVHKNPSLSRAEFLALLRHPLFLLLITGMFLVNIPQVFASSQLKLVAMDIGATDRIATWMVSLYAVGTIVGRCLCGIALDRIRPHLVALAALGLPTVGYLIFASHLTPTSLLIPAVLVIGLAQGAEGDVGGYLLSRQFGVKNFSLLFSFLNMMVGAGTAAGALVLSFTLRASNSYRPFLLIAAAATLIGAVLFGLTGVLRRPGRVQ